MTARPAPTARAERPFATKLASPAVTPELVVLAKVDPARARATIEREVKASVLRPRDIDSARVGEVSFFYAPFWRVNLSVEGFHLGLTTIRSEETVLPIPTGGARSASAAVMVPARSTLPYAARLATGPITYDPTPSIAVELHELTTISGLPSPIPKAERIDADVPREHAERQAVSLLRGSVQPSSALYAKYDATVHDAAAVYYPLFYATYWYGGEGTPGQEEEFFVLLSGRTGKAVSAKHPSAARALAAKFRRLISFDW